MRISSRQNPIVARFRDAARHPGATVALVLDGPHLVATALDVGLAIEVAAVAERVVSDPEVAALTGRLSAAGSRVLTVTDRVLDAMSPVQRPSGLVALGARPDAAAGQLVVPAPALVFVAVQVQDPGNVGALVRAADAAGATGVITTRGGADPFGWKALRGSMGSALRLPVWSDVTLVAVERFAEVHDLQVLEATTRDGLLPDQAALDRPTAILLGGEGHGLSVDARALAVEKVKIPMREGVESLNVATAAALLAYEARRQRQGRW
jgi:TrmH family RNA methyltransferase